VNYAVCDDRRTLLWFANQRAVEYHPTLVRAPGALGLGAAGGKSTAMDNPIYLILDLDPPEGADFSAAVGAAHLVHQALDDLGLSGAVKTSGSKGVHVFVPLTGATSEEAAAATRAIAARAERIDPGLATTAFVREDREGKVFLDSTRSGGATVVAAYSPRVRPGTRVSFPVSWADLDNVTPADFTVHTALDLLGDDDPWAAAMPEPQRLSEELIAEGRDIPIARVAAMHEGKRRKREQEGKK